MEKLSQQEFERLTENASILERDMYGVKVMETPNARIIKLFRQKRRFSSARIVPYAVRFKKNADRLALLGIPSAHVETVADCPTQNRHLVIYAKLEGRSLRESFAGDDDPTLKTRLAAFIATLHQKGVYFRSLHLGNIMLLADRRFALIDVADMRIQKRPLSPRQRARNYRHLLRYRDDWKYFEDEGLDRFIAAYISHAALTTRQEVQFRSMLLKLNPFLNSRFNL